MSKVAIFYIIRFRFTYHLWIWSSYHLANAMIFLTILFCTTLVLCKVVQRPPSAGIDETNVLVPRKLPDPQPFCSSTIFGYPPWRDCNVAFNQATLEAHESPSQRYKFLPKGSISGGDHVVETPRIFKSGQIQSKLLGPAEATGFLWCIKWLTATATGACQISVVNLQGTGHGSSDSATWNDIYDAGSNVLDDCVGSDIGGMQLTGLIPFSFALKSDSPRLNHKQAIIRTLPYIFTVHTPSSIAISSRGSRATAVRNWKLATLPKTALPFLKVPHRSIPQCAHRHHRHQYVEVMVIAVKVMLVHQL